jgi:hypothetical protein
VRELERLLGRKAMKVEILGQALDLAGAKKPICCRAPRCREIQGDDRQCDARRGQPNFDRCTIKRSGVPMVCPRSTSSVHRLGEAPDDDQKRFEGTVAAVDEAMLHGLL